LTGDGAAISHDEGEAVIEFADEGSGHEGSAFASGVIAFRTAVVLSLLSLLSALGPEVDKAIGFDSDSASDDTDFFPIFITIDCVGNAAVAADVFDSGDIDFEFAEDVVLQGYLFVDDFAFDVALIGIEVVVEILRVGFAVFDPLLDTSLGFEGGVFWVFGCWGHSAAVEFRHEGQCSFAYVLE